MVGVPTQSSKGLRVATQCRDVEQFVQAFHRYCEDSGVFISHARRSVGEVVAFSFDLADGSPALTGLGAVIEQFATADNRFGRPGIVIALHRLTRAARRVFDDLTAARIFAQEMGRHDQTPVPLADARAVTSNFQMIDPETLTPIPQLPPRPLDAFPTLAKPQVTKVPEVTDVPLQKPRTATRSIAVIATRPPTTRTPPSMKVPTIVMPPSQAVAQGTSNAPIVPTIAEGTTPPPPAQAAEVAYADPVDEQLAAVPALGNGVVARPEPVVAQPEPVVAPADAVIEQSDAMAEQTTRMATPPYGALVATAPDEPILASATAYESGHHEVPRLSPAPLELVGQPADSHVAEATAPSDAFAQSSAPVMVEVATAHPAPVPASAPMPAVFAPPPPRAPASTRWTKRRIWTVAALAGSSLLALGIVIGATFVAGGTPDKTRSSEAASAPSPTAAPSPAATPATRAPTPAAPPPAAETATPTEAAAPPAANVATPTEAASTPPAAADVAAATVPAHDASKPPSPPKKPPHKHHHHGASAACKSLKCL